MGANTNTQNPPHTEKPCPKEDYINAVSEELNILNMITNTTVVHIQKTNMSSLGLYLLVLAPCGPLF